MERARALQAQTNAVILPMVADPKKDIASERAKGTFNVTELTNLLAGSAQKAQRKRELAEMIASDPRFSKEERHFKKQEELYEMALTMVLHLQEKVVERGITSQEDIDFLRRLLGFPSAADLHLGMFLPTIMGQGTPEQQQEYLPKSLGFQIFGTYAQTELGHGTFLRGLETTATHDPQTGDYVIHSPTISSTKWWPGGLAKTANHVVLMARLFVQGKDHGPHAFLVQIRDFKEHLPLPGIEVGDIGPKMGFQTVDNGYLRFNHFRIPASALLAKNATVTPEGKYERKSGSDSKAAYGTMVLIRSMIVIGAFNSLAKAVTIATRYSAVRRQTTDNPKEMEKQVLDYQNQQYALFPLIAQSFALHFTGQYMRRLYFDFVKGKNASSADLAELHATSSGLKALVTTLTSEAIEVCRKACGGHGYSHFSGLPLLYEDYVSTCTYEGENTVMHLQTARYLMKAARQSLKGQPLFGNCKYLADPQKLPTQACSVQKAEDFLNPEVQLQAYHHRAAHVIFETVQALDAKIKGGLNPAEAWNSCITDLVRCSQAHCYVILITNYLEALKTLPASPIRSVLKTLSDLFALTNIERNLGEFVEDGFLKQSQVKILRATIKQLLSDVRPNAVALVDSFDLHDYELQSALGRYDGDVYNALYQWAQKAPLNKSQTGPGYKELLQERFRSNL